MKAKQNKECSFTATQFLRCHAEVRMDNMLAKSPSQEGCCKKHFFLCNSWARDVTELLEVGSDTEWSLWAFWVKPLFTAEIT